MTNSSTIALSAGYRLQLFHQLLSQTTLTVKTRCLLYNYPTCSIDTTVRDAQDILLHMRAIHACCQLAISMESKMRPWSGATGSLPDDPQASSCSTVVLPSCDEPCTAQQWYWYWIQHICTLDEPSGPANICFTNAII